MRSVMIAFARALLTQLHFKMLMLTIVPFILSLLLWGAILWVGLQPLIDWIQAYFAAHDGFRLAGETLSWLGLGTVKYVLVPLLAMWLLLPLMILTSLIFVGAFAMPAIVKHVASRDYASLEKRKGGSWWGSLWISTLSFAVFAALWIITLPLHVFPPLIFLIQPVLWGWLAYRVMAYDALAEHASDKERTNIMRSHRWPLLLIGTVCGALGAAPTLLWLGGALSIIFLPLLAGVSIWLYVLVFVFSGLWFEHYCLAALATYRAMAVNSPDGIRLKEIN